MKASDWARVRTVGESDSRAAAAELMRQAAGALARAGLAARPGDHDGWLTFGPTTSDDDIDRFCAELGTVGLAAGAGLRVRTTREYKLIVYRPTPTVYGDDGRAVCPDCHSRGDVGCPACGGLCWLCDGEGRVTCDQCDGEPVTERNAQCTRCRGLSGDCSRCDGEGTVSVETTCRACAGQGDVPCPRGCPEAATTG